MTAVPLPSHCRPNLDDSHDRLPSQHPSVGRESAVVSAETAERYRRARWQWTAAVARRLPRPELPRAPGASHGLFQRGTRGG